MLPRSKVNRVAQTETNQVCELEQSDRELVDEFLAGNESAFNKLVLKHQLGLPVSVMALYHCSESGA